MLRLYVCVYADDVSAAEPASMVDIAFKVFGAAFALLGFKKTTANVQFPTKEIRFLGTYLSLELDSSDASYPNVSATS